MLTENSTIKEINAHPIGRDIIKKILMQTGNKGDVEKIPFIGGVRLKNLPRLLGGRIDRDFIGLLLDVLNSEKDVPRDDEIPVEPAWWKEAVFYQIYPRSFYDSNGDGIGDIPGITAKLDYLKQLGVDAVWLSPVCDSPNDDNGYDIRDYRKIMAEFGTMEDFDELLRETHARGMKLIMDLVVNHTSDEHEWFKSAVENPGSRYSDYYFFREKPNNWTSFFGGSAWKYIQERDEYALCLFSRKQMDLNWDNPNVRRDVGDIVRWWLEKGVDGFRMDVINFISKRDGLPDGNENIGSLMGFTGVEHFFYGPRLHEYLHELRREAIAPYGAFTVGETPGIGMEMSKLLTGGYRGELDMVFNFDHLENPGKSRFDRYEYDLNYYKEIITDWMENYTSHCWPSLFFENHDNPRMVSKVDADPRRRDVLAKLLALIQLTLRGTPFIYQGQELGMINKKFTSINDLRDVESLNLYSRLKEELGDREAFERVLAGTRDHARTPMQWTDGKNAGFSGAEPWIGTDNDHRVCNVQAQQSDESSVFNFYRELIKLRKKHRALIYGSIEIVNKSVKNLFTYYRKGDGEIFYIECNLGREILKRKGGLPKGERLLSNYGEYSQTALRPYEAAVWKIK